ncbi:MAG: hypothetical protein ACR2LU_10490, partial [Luteitalea sp.]
VDAVGVLLDAARATVASSALDALTTVLLDRTRPEPVRVRALEAISQSLDAAVVAPLRAQLQHDPSDALRRAAAGEADTAHPAAPATSGAAVVIAAADGDLPDDPEPVRLAVVAHGATVALTSLHRLIERTRAREGREDVAGDHGRLEAWRVLRATVHQALAGRGSRLAVYDLRETLAVLGAQTPVGMLSALQQVADASVLDAVAEAYADSDDAWFRGQLATIFREIVGRDGVTRRHAVIRKVATRAPAALAALWPGAARQ